MTTIDRAEEYERLRQRCRQMWGFHPDTKDSIYEMWAKLNNHSGYRRNVAEPSAALLLGDLATFADKCAGVIDRSDK